MDTSGQHRLALIEIEGRDGRVTRTVDVWHWPLAIGRALDNQLVIDDPFVAAHHAQLAPDGEGRLALHVLASRNGVLLAPPEPAPAGRRRSRAQRVAEGQSQVLPAGGARLQIGESHLRLRLPDEVLAPERVLPPGGARAGLAPAAAALLLVLLVLAERWIETDPGAEFTTAWLPMLTALPVGVMAWCGTWALLSKLFQHRFAFAAHLRIALPWLVAISLLGLLWQPLAAALGSTTLWRAAGPLTVLLSALMLRQHLVAVLPGAPRRAVSAALAAGLLAYGGITLAANQRLHGRWMAAPYMNTLPTPAFNLSSSGSAADLVAGLGPVAGKLAERVRKAKAEDNEAGDDDGE